MNATGDVRVRGREERVLFVSTVSSLEGGAERSMLELARVLRHRGRPSALAVWRAGPLVDEFASIGETYVFGSAAEPASPLGGYTTGLPLVASLVRFLNDLRLRLRPLQKEAAWLETVIRRSEAVVIHTNCDISPPAARVAAERTGTPWVAHVRDDWRSWFHPRTVEALGAADVLVAPSRFLARRFRDGGLDPIVIPNPVEGGALRRPLDPEDRSRLRAEIAPGGGFVVAVVGRLDRQKGTLRVVDVARRLAGVRPEIRFLMAGAGSRPFERSLGRTLDEQGVADRVRLLGHRDDVARWLPAADCLMAPSTGEPFGRMIVEGMHAGLPVVAFRDGAAPEIIRHDETGILVPPHDTALLAGAVLELARDPGRAQRIGAGARTAAEAYEPGAIAGAVEDLYMSLRGDES